MALTRDQLQAFLAIVNPRYRTFFKLLAATGLRISELPALRWRHLRLDGERPSLRVRRAYVRGATGPPKSKYGRRELPLPPELAAELRTRRAAAGAGDAEHVFAVRTGAIPDASKLRRDAVTPATYVHLLSDDLGAPLALPARSRSQTASVNGVQPGALRKRLQTGVFSSRESGPPPRRRSTR